ncbi:major facilitator superfamily domain-containing protein [Melampsora americana]|nr:major facilitator superfamily domain-containing protein [Melampsora americana]
MLNEKGTPPPCLTRDRLAGEPRSSQDANRNALDDRPASNFDSGKTTVQTCSRKSASIVFQVTHPVPPVTDERGRWTYLGAMFVLETIIWGFASSYGVLLDYYLHSDFAKEPRANFLLPLVGTINTGLMALLIPFVSVILNRYPNVKSKAMFLGLMIMSPSLLLSSFSNHSIHVLFALGVGYGTGGVLVYYPALTYLPEWFPDRPGLANGIVFSGNGLGGLVFPYIIEILLARCGVRAMLRYLTLIVTISVGTSVYFVRSPKTASEVEKLEGETIFQTLGDLRALKAGALWVYILANILETFSYFIPCLYLPNYAHSQGLPALSGTTLLATINIANIVSRIIFGLLSDHFSTHLIGGATSLVAAASVVGFWGLLVTTGLPGLIVFSIIFGVTSGAWTSLYFSVIKEWKVDERTTLTMYSLFALTRGLANIIVGPISSALLQSTTPHVSSRGFSSDYSNAIIFCAATMFAAAGIEAGLYIHEQLGHQKKRKHSEYSNTSI